MKYKHIVTLWIWNFTYLNSRELYDKFPVPGGEYSVSTLNRNITSPSGVESGYYKGKYGCFISSSALQAVYFINLHSYSPTLVAGTPHLSGSDDGQLLYSTFFGPTRMAYDYMNSRLFITERKSGFLRVLDFSADHTKTVRKSSGEPLRFNMGVQASSNFPGLDVQLSGQTLYVVDTLRLYAVTSSSATLNDLVTDAVVREYTSLADYFNLHDYPASATARSCVYSVAPDEKRKVLYVGISYAKNVILQVPMDISQPYTAISVLVGDEANTYQGVFGGYGPPIAANGNIREGPSAVRLSFPMHLRLAPDGSALLFSEAYPSTSDGSFMFGSLTIRRLDFESDIVDTYCGVDFSALEWNSSLYEVLGSAGGFHDGEVTTAEFSFPMSFTILSHINDDSYEKSDDSEFLSLVVADNANGAVRLVAAFMDTVGPTPSPTALLLTKSPTLDRDDLSLVPRGDNATHMMSLVILGVVCLCLCCCYILWLAFIPRQDSDKLESTHSVGSLSDIGERQWATHVMTQSYSACSRKEGDAKEKSRLKANFGLMGAVSWGIKQFVDEGSEHFPAYDSAPKYNDENHLLDLSISSHSGTSSNGDADVSAQVKNPNDAHNTVRETPSPTPWSRVYEAFAGVASSSSQFMVRRSATTNALWQNSERWDQVEESVIML